MGKKQKPKREEKKPKKPKRDVAMKTDAARGRFETR